DVERAADQDFDAFPRSHGTERDANCSLVEDVVAAGDGATHGVTVTHIAFDDVDRAASPCIGEILGTTTNEIVEDTNLVRPFVDQLVDDVRTDESHSAGHEDRAAFQRLTHRGVPSRKTTCNASITRFC